MKLYGYGPRSVFVLALLLAGAITANGQRNYHDQTLDLIRFLATVPWDREQWDREPRVHLDYARNDWAPRPTPGQADADGLDEENRVPSTKRSALTTALSGRRRRQPTTSLGKVITPYISVGILNNMDNFITALRENVYNVASLSPQQRTTLFQNPPTVVLAPSSDGNNGNSGGGGGGGFSGDLGTRHLHALRPLRPTGNIRTYNRRSFVEPETVYPGANHHDPGYLWTGLGR